MATIEGGQGSNTNMKPMTKEENRQAGEPAQIGSEGWLRERFPDKDWHRHRGTDGRSDLCDGTPSDCASKARL